MNAVEILLSQRWVLRANQPDLYYQIKDEIGRYRRILMEKFGYTVLITPALVKLDKIPGQPEPWMGINTFEEPGDYAMLCQVLMFLETREKEEQFDFTMLTEYLQSQGIEENLDWTQYARRRQLVRVLRFCEEQGIMKKIDGSDELFLRDEQAEVLFENTGISRFFLRNCARDLMEYTGPEDFIESDWIDIDQDRGIVRRQRVYRRLLLSPGVYRQTAQDEDFTYLRNQRSQVERDFQALFDCDLHLHRSSAYLVLDEACSAGRVFPGNKAVQDLILILAQAIQQRIKKHQAQYEPQGMEEIHLPEDSLIRLLKKIVSQRQDYLPKYLQGEGAEIAVKQTLAEMENLGFIERHDDQIHLMPIFGKLAGDYTAAKGE